MQEPSGYEPSYQQTGYQQQPLQPAGTSSMAATAQLFARLSQEIEEKKPPNCIHFIVGFLCQHYPEHLHGFASIWQMDPDLERERHEVVNFFKSHKISTAVAAHFTNAGYDTLDTLTTLSPDSLVDVECFNNVKWLPGHKVRLQQIFGEISARVRAYRQQYGNQAGRGYQRTSSPVIHRPSSPHQAHQAHQWSPQVTPALTAHAHAALPTTHVGTALPATAIHAGGLHHPSVTSSYAPTMMAPAGLGHAMPALPANGGNIFLQNHYSA